MSLIEVFVYAARKPFGKFMHVCQKWRQWLEPSFTAVSKKMQLEMADFPPVPPPGELDETYMSSVILPTIMRKHDVSHKTWVHNRSHCCRRLQIRLLFRILNMGVWTNLWGPLRFPFPLRSVGGVVPELRVLRVLGECKNITAADTCLTYRKCRLHCAEVYLGASREGVVALANGRRTNQHHQRRRLAYRTDGGRKPSACLDIISTLLTVVWGQGMPSVRYLDKGHDGFCPQQFLTVIYLNIEECKQQRDRRTERMSCRALFATWRVRLSIV